MANIIDNLIDLFKQLEKLAEQVPSKNNKLWEQCYIEAEKESDALKQYYGGIGIPQDSEEWKYLEEKNFIGYPSSLSFEICKETYKK